MQRLTSSLCLSLCLCAHVIAQPAADPARACIDAVYARDDQIGALRNHAPENAPIAQAVRDYAEGLAMLDFNGCPALFKEAFAAHERAWRDAIPYFERHADERGEMHAVFARLRAGDDGEQLKALEKAIWDSWTAVEAAGQARD
ncbi:MAG: hypothetical protein ACT4NL_11265 [Pseudomarimonas sp.]